MLDFSILLHRLRPLALVPLLAAAPYACGGTEPTGGTGGTSSASSSTGTGQAGTGGSSSSSTGTGGAAVTCAGCVTVATLTPGSQPYGLFVDATSIYWTNFGSGEVLQAGLDGSSPVTLTTGEISPIAVHVLDGFVYWASYAESGVLRRAPVGGGTVVDLMPAPAARDLFVGNGFIWWTREPDDVQRGPIDGLSDAGEPDLLSSNPLANGITADATRIYWVNRLDGSVKRADHDLTNETVLAQGEIPWDVAVDGASIYWTEQGSGEDAGKVMRASKLDGSGATQIAADATGPQGIAVDATNVYWTNKNDGSIKRAPIAGGAVTVIAEGQSAPASIVVDANFVYWTNTDGDTIVRAPK
ncbi:MAG: hypothetical protein QM820_24245 [Minicystis sp.]